MPQLRLTETLLSQYTLPDRVARVELWDTVVDGLYLRVSPRARTWYVRAYSGGARTRNALGGWPGLSLSAARDAARRIAAGLSPETAAPLAGGTTWAYLCDQFIGRAFPRLAPATQTQWRGVIERELRATIGEVNAAEPKLLRGAVLNLLARLERRSPYTHNRTLMVMRRIYNWSVGRDLVAPAPVFAGVEHLPERPRERVLSDEEVRKILAAVALDYPEWRAYWLLLFYTAMRRGTVLAARWSDFDLEQGVWLVPSEIIKGRPGQRRATAVPLVASLVSGLRLQREIGGTRPCVISNLKTGHAVRNPQKAAARVCGASGVMGWHVHDIRHTISTGMARLRIEPHVIDAILGHSSGPRMRRVYNQWDYFDEKREALERWAAHLEGLKRPAA